MRQVARRRKMQMSVMMIGKGSGFSPGGMGLCGTNSVVVTRNPRRLGVGEVSFPTYTVFIFPAMHNINRNKVI